MGDEFLMVKDRGRIIMRNMRSIANDLKKDFEFADRTEKAWQERDKGRFETKTKNNFLKELKTC